ncbi:MAG: UbiH/UbiF/VisC/COQ6 family ubiquinone biosynthesis hydroxylase [Pseudomonadota bacterium]
MSKRIQIKDIAIIGGGLSGLALACILAQNGLEVVCIDKEDTKKTLKTQYDGRTTAISAGSKNVLEQAGIWNDIIKQGCPIRDIHITDSGSPILLEFLSADVSADAFGWIFENLTLRQALIKKAKKLKSLTHFAPAEVSNMRVDDSNVTISIDDKLTIEAKLLIGADGRGSFVRQWAGIETRQWSYNQQAVICTVTHENSHDNIAVEDFRAEGPFAILPMEKDKKGQHRSSVVWTEHNPKNSAMDWSEQTFNAGLTARFPERYGDVKLASKRFVYPLGLIHAHDYIAPRTALVADAAHGIHPIAGQGLNLGYRDIAELSKLLITAKSEREDLGNVALLEKYQKARRMDNMTMAAATDSLNALFSNPVTPVRLVRKMGLKAIQKITPTKKFFMRQAMGTQKL